MLTFRSITADVTFAEDMKDKLPVYHLNTAWGKHWEEFQESLNGGCRGKCSLELDA